MWPWDRQQEPQVELYDIDWRETSFVPAGDNPPARIVMWKNDPLTDQEIEEIIDEVGRQDVTKTSVRGEAARIAKERYPKLPEAAGLAKVFSESEELRRRFYAAQDPEQPEPTTTTVHKGAEAFAKLDAEAQKLRPDLYRQSPSRARTEVGQLRPDLLAEYHRATVAR